METKYILPLKYIEEGFKLSGFGNKSLALKHHEKIIFVFYSDLDLKNDFVSRLCESYLKLAKTAIDKGLTP
jgi:hypothetical protein